MKILVVGAGWQIGRQLCASAHSDGHDVAAVQADRSVPRHVTIVDGTLSDPDTLGAAMDGVDAVCCTLGPADGPADSTETVITAMADAEVDRLVAVSTAAVLQATPTRLRIDTTGSYVADNAAAHMAVYEQLRASDLDWTLACPPAVSDGASTHHYRTAVDYLPEGGQSISAGDVAAFIYRTVLEGRHSGERVGLAY
jgi:putative NADH-flavin reductase